MSHANLMMKMPAPIAATWKAYEQEPPSFRKLLRLVDAYEALLKYCAVIAIQNFYKASLANEFPKVDRLIRERIMRPALGHWAELLREVMKCFEQHHTALFCPELLEFQRQKNVNEASQQLNRLRNEYVGHGAVLPDEDAALLVQHHEKDLQTLLKRASFLADFPLLFVEAQTSEGQFQVKPLMGIDYPQSLSQTLSLPSNCPSLPVGHVVIQNPKTSAFLDLHPLLLYTECVENIGGRECRRRKVMFFNELRDDQRRIAFLDHWQGHHSRFRHPNPLPDEFRQHFPKPPRPESKANWFEDLVRELTAYFVGRDKELNAIDRFVESSPKKVLVVIGAPGMGKSALLAKWADEHQSVRHFLREGDAITYEPVQVFKNLAVQLSEKYGIAWKEPDQPDPAAYRSAFEQTLQEASRKGQVTLVIDGLDEGVRAQARGKSMEAVQTLVDWLPEPNFLPESVKMILSTRPELPEHRSFAAKYGEDKAEHLHLGRMTDADVRALLYQVKSKDEVLENQAYVEAIVERSEGNPLYLRMLLEDIAEGRITFGDINQLPRGVIAYFGRILDFIEGEGRTREMPDVEVILKAKRETLERLVQGGILTQEQVEEILERERAALEGRAGVKSVELLALYCLVKEPVSIEEAAKMLNADGMDAHRAFEVIRTILVGDGEGRFAIFHSAFRDYFLNLGKYTDDHLHRHAKTIEGVRQKILDYCTHWQQHKSHYALRHFAHHLYDDPTKWEQLFGLARDEKFAQTQREVLPNEPELPLLTIQLALDAAIRTEKPETMAEMVLRHALHLSKVETPLQAQRRGESERAIGLAKQRLERDHERGTLWFLLLAWSWEMEGERELAERCLKEISQWWQERTLEKLRGWQGGMTVVLLGELLQAEGWLKVGQMVLRDEDLSSLASHLAQKGKFEEAMKVAEGIEGAGWHSSALAEIAVGMAKAKEFDRAVELARGIEKAEWRSNALARIAGEMMRAGMKERAKEISETAVETAKGIEDVRDRSKELVEIAEKIAEAKEFEKAIELAMGIKDEWWCSNALAEIAVKMAKAKEFERAIELAREIEKARWRSKALAEIAVEMMGAGMEGRAKEIFETAVETAKGIEDGKWCSKALAEIAGEMMKAGMKERAKEVFEVAVETASGIKDAWWRLEALVEISEKMAEAKEFERAIELANGIKETWLHSRALAEIAMRIAEAKGLEEAIELAKGIKDKWLRSSALTKIAREMVRAGMKERAKEVFETAVEAVIEVDDGRWRSEALAEIAVGMAKAKEFERAIKLAKGIEDEGWRSRALAKIAEKMAEAEEFERAVELAKGIKCEWWHSSALAEIAVKVAKAKEFERAIELAKEVKEPWKRSNVLARIAREMMEVGMEERAKEIFEIAVEAAKGIEDGEWCSRALAEIAGEMMKAGMKERAKEVFEVAVETANGIKDAKWRSNALAKIAGEMMRAGMKERAKEVFETTYELANGIKDAKGRSEALAKIAEEMANAGMKSQAQETLEQAWQAAKEKVDFYRLWQVAITAARSGFEQKAVEFARQISWERKWCLPSVLNALAERGAKEAVKSLLDLCGWAISTAVSACACLAHLYPEHTKSIGELVKTMR